MRGLKQLIWALTTPLVMSSGIAHATLNDLGGGLLYDDVLDITWLQDANYALTSGYPHVVPGGRMNWSEATTWAANLTFHDTARSVDITGWRLASNAPVSGGAFNSNFSYDGTTDRGYNVSSPLSELAYMYYVNLGLKGEFSAAGVSQPDFGVYGNGNTGGQKDIGLVKNLQAADYWSGTGDSQLSSFAWQFDFGPGQQAVSNKLNIKFAWAVHPGNVAAVPEPEAYALLLAGLGLIGLAVKRRRRPFDAP